MAEVKPPPRDGATVWGYLVGVPLGLLGGCIIDIVLLSLAVNEGQCGTGIVMAIAGVVAGAALAYAAWCAIARRGAGGFGPAFTCGLTAAAAAWTLIPWPCSATWTTLYVAYGACKGS